MAAQASSKPARPVSPLVVRRKNDNKDSDFRRLLPAVLISIVFNFGLVGLFLLAPGQADAMLDDTTPPDVTVQQQAQDDKKDVDPLVTTDIDPAAQTPNQDINFNVERKNEVSVPGQVTPLEQVGIQDGDKNAPPINLPAPGGLGGIGQGGAIESPYGQGTSMAPGMAGGYGLKGLPLAGTFYGRSGATRKQVLIDGGGTKESEAAVVSGLQWIVRNQSSDGRWLLDGNFKDRGSPNDIAGTAFGLLPLLGAGKTHKRTKDNDFDKPVEKGLLYLMRKQDRKTGNFGGGMYAHGLATIAMCEAYGLTQDAALRRPAQMAVNYIVRAQHSAGGWRYSPGQAGDTSVVGWQVMALKSAQMAGLDVPEITMRKAQAYLNACEDSTKGYGYTGPGPSPTMSAVGLLCRQYLQSWGPQNLSLIKGVDNHLKTNPPGQKNIYYYYYATQVMHHFGGSAWKAWNEKMRDYLVKTQDNSGPNKGSWSSAGDPHAGSGGRLMSTSLSLLTLEVYYRHLPLYYRDSGAKMAAK
ncbi:MAG: terpene cyclase/mutase family protein [Planctomycetes bacterium]|nr:terpene cyclase/mutase family protein [Planctomycetota bacterium]